MKRKSDWQGIYRRRFRWWHLRWELGRWVALVDENYMELDKWWEWEND